MNLSRFYSWIPLRSARRVRAILSEELIERLLKKYNITEDIYDVEGAQWLNRFWKSFTNKEDLLTEWVLRSISRGSGRGDDVHRFREAVTLYFNEYKKEKYKRVVQRYAQENNLNLNPKNLLDFTLHQLEDINELYLEPEVDPRVNELSGKLPPGATLFYNDGVYQIVEVKTPGAACDLARGTRWCTSDEGNADYYLGKSPLYVIYLNGKKTFQFHAGDEIQLMDLRDREITPDPGLRAALIKSGLFSFVLESLEWSFSAEIRNLDECMRWLGREPDDQVKSTIMGYSWVSTYYASYILKGRFPEAERSIAELPEASLYYAQSVLRGRFPQGEPGMIQSPFLSNYVHYLAYLINHKKSLKDFIHDYPNEKKLDRFRYLLFLVDIHYNGKDYHATFNYKRDSSGRLLMEYVFQKGSQEEVIWADEDGHVVSASAPDR